MTRESFLQILKAYGQSWGQPVPYKGATLSEERGILARLLGFVEANGDCFDRSNQQGHITGSALVVDPQYERVLLTLHRKLGAWLQLGGHLDGNSQVHAGAMREAVEESGLEDLQWVGVPSRLFASDQFQGSSKFSGPPIPFDLDVHSIPARGDEPEHFHYDVRYLIMAPRPQGIVRSEESKDLRWFSLSGAREITQERSMHRQFDKLVWFREQQVRSLDSRV